MIALSPLTRAPPACESLFHMGEILLFNTGGPQGLAIWEAVVWMPRCWGAPANHRQKGGWRRPSTGGRLEPVATLQRGPCGPRKGCSGHLSPSATRAALIPSWICGAGARPCGRLEDRSSLCTPNSDRSSSCTLSPWGASKRIPQPELKEASLLRPPPPFRPHASSLDTEPTCTARPDRSRPGFGCS